MELLPWHVLSREGLQLHAKLQWHGHTPLRQLLRHNRYDALGGLKDMWGRESSGICHSGVVRSCMVKCSSRATPQCAIFLQQTSSP